MEFRRLVRGAARHERVPQVLFVFDRYQGTIGSSVPIVVAARIADRSAHVARAFASRGLIAY